MSVRPRIELDKTLLHWSAETLNSGCLKPAMSNPRPSLGLRCSKSIPHTDNLSYFDDLELDIFDAGGLQCRFITSVTDAVRIRTL